MELEERALRLKVYLGESDHYKGVPAYKAVVHHLREKGIWGATVTRGTYGYGKRSRLHAVSPLRISEDMPVVVEAVDSEKKILEVVPAISEMVKGGLVTVDEVKVLRHIG